MSIQHQLNGDLRTWFVHRRLGRVYNLFKDFTMIPRSAYIDNLRLAELVRDVPGCVVECGVWRGGMIAGMGMVLGPRRDYFLFDSFEGLPPAREVDGKAALDWQRDKESPGYHDNCAAGKEHAQQAMQRAGIKTYHLKQGWFEQTLPGFRPPALIALLRLDGDWYESTMTCLTHLFDFVAPGGLVLLDDYYTWDGCSQALHDFLAKRRVAERIRSLGDICWLEKVEGGIVKVA